MRRAALQEWKQRTLDAGVAGLARQHFEQSMGEYIDVENDTVEGCVYRNPGGQRCIAGHLIPDELYSPAFEGKGIAPLLDEQPSLALHLCGTHEPTSDQLDFLVDLQQAHDLGHGPEEMRRQLRTIAEQHELDVPAVLL